MGTVLLLIMSVVTIAFGMSLIISMIFLIGEIIREYNKREYTQSGIGVVILCIVFFYIYYLIDIMMIS